ncbi:hypothetical protein M199_gp212 [Halogranum tailed virus 1]|uniref:Uncharacterized protein n=1 Tax=Halogranum tailed virus 1 TaxID=1273749 RepID=R4T6X9_9CAUD|nr:hypothetical protein M199_gp212 [Halogranum tailed virus 1]AGM11454.1 hypothetical protein HGTV1_157 [Halogranum tailed virus 1]
MAGFSFTALAECEMCGAPLSSSDEDCENCAEAEDVLLVFRKLNTHETKTLAVSMMADRTFIWEKFAKSLDGEDPLPWVILGLSDTVEGLLEGVMFDDITDLKHNGMTIDYRGEEDLRELASYEEV